MAKQPKAGKVGENKKEKSGKAPRKELPVLLRDPSPQDMGYSS